MIEIDIGKAVVGRPEDAIDWCPTGRDQIVGDGVNGVHTQCFIVRRTLFQSPDRWPPQKEYRESTPYIPSEPR